jgi:ATP-dependent helicase/nuclease subunit A
MSAQRDAADPGHSVWVTASAGTGKTKVLTDRVLSLLLAGTRPARLLCLTFTKAAAAEMANRIAARLADWAVWDDARLAADLAELTGAAVGEERLVRARTLFAQVLDAPGGFPIDTIHAFCQSLLRRFPLEAGLAPHFQVMDERDAGEVLAAAREEVLAGPGELAEALAGVTGRVHETLFPELMAALSAQRGRLTRLFAAHDGSVEAIAAALKSRLGLAETDSEASLVALACATADELALRRAARALADGSPAETERAAAIVAWLAAPPAERAARFVAWCALFLTGTGEVRARLCTKDTLARAPETQPTLEGEGRRLQDVLDRLRSLTVWAATRQLLHLAKALLDSYARHKASRAMLDYDDLILGAVALLRRPDAAAWVLFKLDGIDHVLIDEAQDTNPDQWAVIEALTAEFFAGRGRTAEGKRTVFAVGDPKQSIYSFQGADPASADAMRRRLAEIVPAGRGAWRDVTLDMSYRSAPAVLAAVDHVFAMAPARDGVVADGVALRHRPWRAGAAGLVELWPPVEPLPADDDQPWKPPVERRRGDNPLSRLAGLVAARIHAMVATPDRLESKDRPIRPGDILVLVRRRNAFVEDLVRRLKGLGVAVAGADRMVLTEQLAVMDLMALGNALLLPDDDLTLATVLKGPLVGLSEQALFDLAWRRPGSLWQALRAKSGEAPYDAAWTLLAGLANLADAMPPHDLFAHILTHGGKKRMLAALGPEAEDPLDEFIGLTLAYERLHPPSLQGFLRWLAEGEIDIKRETAGGGAVRIMTVHGAKGLQAPIVFLPDTLQAPTRTPPILWLDGTLPAWPPRAADRDAACRAAVEQAKRLRDEEYRRLLYVAMTRAEDRLYVCGWRSVRQPADDCWYNLIARALAPHCQTVSCEGIGPVLRLANPQTGPADESGKDAPTSRPTPLPAWVDRAAPAEPVSLPPLLPSGGDGDEATPVGDPGARDRGRLVHRLLQRLPEVAAADRPRIAGRFLDRHGVAAGERDEIVRAVTAILADYPALFGPGSRAEVPVVGRIGDRLVSGQIDRLVVGATEVLIVDFKTTPRPPEQVPEAYRRQLAAYRAVLSALHPDKEVTCALLWTAIPRLDVVAPAP